MKDKKYNSDSRLKELNKMEELYKKIESHHKYLKHVNKKKRNKTNRDLKS